MIVLITSTICPPPGGSLSSHRDVLRPEVRLAQTKLTIESLRKLGYDNIILADNSGVNNVHFDFFHEFSDVKFLKIGSPQFHNKGLSELFLLKEALTFISDCTSPLLKISGRYVLTRRHSLQEDYKFLYKREGDLLSTRLLLACDSIYFSKAIDEMLFYMLNYNARIIGPRSLWRILNNSLFPVVNDFHVDLMMESAAMFVLKKYKCMAVQELGIAGVVSTTDFGAEFFITE